MDNTEKDKLSFFANKTVKFIWILFFAVSLILLIGGGLLDYYISNNEVRFEIALNMVSIICITLGSVVMTSAVGSVIFTETGLLEMFKIELADILISAKYIDLLKEEKLFELRKEINKKIYSKEIGGDETSLLNVVYTSIDPLVEKYYFDEYHIEVHCRINEKYIEKTVTREMTIKPAAAGKVLPLELKELYGTSYKSLGDEGVEEVELRDFCIGGVSYKKKIELMHVKNTDTNYPNKCILSTADKEIKEKLVLNKKGVKIKIVTKNIVDKDDTLFVHKLPVSCKKYSARFNYTESQCSVEACSFGFLDSIITDKCETQRIDDTAIVIRFSDWILPGDGVAFSINKKKI